MSTRNTPVDKTKLDVAVGAERVVTPDREVMVVTPGREEVAVSRMVIVCDWGELCRTVVEMEERDAEEVAVR